MKTAKPWRGVRMRRVRVGPDPDAAPRLVTIPASWDAGAAAALAAIMPGSAPVRLADAAEAFIRPLAQRAREQGASLPLGERLHLLLLTRRGAPDASVWRGRRDGAAGFVLNLASFFDPDSGFLSAAFSEAVEAASFALAFAASETRRPALRIADLAGLIAALGLDYDSAAARDLGSRIATLLRDGVDRVAALCPARSLTIVLASPGPAEALLGVETGGVAPAFSPLDVAGSLTRASRAWLAARRIATGQALAQALLGAPVFPEASPAAHAAMRERMLPLFDSAPEMPAWQAAAPARRGRELPPSPARGYMQKASVGTHKLYVRTGEYADGRLAEVAITAARQGAMVRNLLDALSGALSIALQHGVPLEEFAEALSGNEPGAALAVEGDPKVSRAASLPDYVFRHLAANYAPNLELPPLPESTNPAEEAAMQASGTNGLMLPLELPPRTSAQARRRAFRVVAK